MLLAPFRRLLFSMIEHKGGKGQSLKAASTLYYRSLDHRIDRLICLYNILQGSTLFV
jgi:hypothetical protein